MFGLGAGTVYDVRDRSGTLATRGSSTGYFEGAVMLLGLVAAGCVITVVTRMATGAMAELEAPETIDRHR